MHITTSSTLAKRPAADALVLPFWQGKKEPEAAFKTSGFDSFLEPLLRTGDFCAKEGECLFIYLPKKSKEKRLLLLGLGSKKSSNAETLRCAYASAVKVCTKKKNSHLNLLLPDGASCEAICEGVLLANYAFDRLKGEKESAQALLTHLCLIGAGTREERACKRIAQIVSSVNFVRDLVNGNADEVTPQKLAHCARELAKLSSRVKTHILDRKQLEKEKMGLLLAVGRGSAVDPLLATLEYRGNPKSKECIALVGKGVTYDTGGLNLKPTGGMETMKCDMAGAATVLGVVRAVAQLGLKVNLVGVIACTENAIGPKSYKPGDVYRSHAGLTVEIGNTDAEGRLILADALSYVQTKMKPTRIVDLATLTGAIVIALGEEATGLFSNDDRLSQELTRAGERTGERIWRMPLYPEHTEAMRSKLADIRNSSGHRRASSSTAAAFIQFFIKDLPWAHLDIAGTAYLTDPRGYNPTLATGAVVRLLTDWLSSLE
jgi:leucyl aminopeptidase